MTLNRQFLIFIGGGLTSAVIDIGMLQFMLFAGANYIFAVTGGFLLGLLVNFIFHANLTFRSTMKLSIFLRFVFVVAINYLITIAFVSISFSMFENVLIGKIASLPVIAIIGFLSGKHWIFK